ncbi:hypothetical protein J7F02_16295 [Streptomyces sp. ISL-112]|uniref:hypothetical protein n=1 Tax=unclassified Streptomyces TaxID=2593676 RepID=UPI001BE9AA1F|nr:MULTISPECIES: hypothetical protein [unclassified Streptomyces]MBT2427186.1 hypothetical protein [Streptomyces sp. ISL-112]MBT2461745.1 hypothetical protein [Streptomyces sp. ISL-63]
MSLSSPTPASPETPTSTTSAPPPTAAEDDELAVAPRWLPSPYVLLGGLLWAVLSAAAWRVPMCCEAGLNAAVVERLRASLLHPAFPMTDLPAVASAHYSPYAVVQGLTARAGGLSGQTVLALSAAVNLALLLTGIGRLARLLTPNRWVPVLALIPLALIHWADPGRWSAPGTFAVAVTLHLWAWTGHAVTRLPRAGSGRPPGRAPRWVEAAGIGVLLGLVLLVHPPTALGAALGVVALVAVRQRTRIRPTLRRWALAGLCAVAVAAVWPYYNGLTAVRPPASAGDTARPETDRAPVTGEPYTWATAHVPPGDVVLTDSVPAMYALAGHGAYILADGVPDAGLLAAERRERSRAVATYLDAATAQEERDRITGRYGVRWVLLTRFQKLPGDASVLAYSPRTGEVLARVPER